MEPWYRFETLPILRRDIPEGGTTTDFGDLSGRVIENYTNMPIGAVIYEADGTFHAHPFFPEPNPEDELPDTWGPRADLAAQAIWTHYRRGIALRERIPRYLWRFQRAGWLVFGTIIGAGAQAILRSL